jgi:hypothetical protein
MNGKEVGITKCGVVGSSPDEFYVLAGGMVPRVDSYLYLGFPHKKSGIDFPQHIERMSKKATGVLVHAKTVGAHWSPVIKFSVFKVFIRSVLEYGDVLVQAWLEAGDNQVQVPRKVLDRKKYQREKNKRRNIASSYSSVYQESVSWILGTSKYTECFPVLGLAKPEERMIGKLVSFQVHLRKMQEDHPLKGLGAASVRRGFFKPGTIWSYVSKYPLFSELKRLTGANGTSLKKEIRRWQWGRLGQDSSMMLYIQEKCRNNPFGFDMALGIQDEDLRRAAVQWRVNAFQSWGRCSVCNHGFNRAHVNKCLRRLDSESWRLNEMVEGELPEHYCLLDELLNQKNYEGFKLKLELANRYVSRGTRFLQ